MTLINWKAYKRSLCLDHIGPPTVLECPDLSNNCKSVLLDFIQFYSFVPNGQVGFCLWAAIVMEIREAALMLQFQNRSPPCQNHLVKPLFGHLMTRFFVHARFSRKQSLCDTSLQPSQTRRQMPHSGKLTALYFYRIRARWGIGWNDFTCKWKPVQLCGFAHSVPSAGWPVPSPGAFPPKWLLTRGGNKKTVPF